MRNFSGYHFLWTRIYEEIFKSAFVHFFFNTKTSILDVAVALDPPLNTHEMLELLLQLSNAVHYNENSEYYIVGSSF